MCNLPEFVARRALRNEGCVPSLVEAPAVGSGETYSSQCQEKSIVSFGGKHQISNLTWAGNSRYAFPMQVSR